MKMQITDVLEQRVIFEGKPDFMSGSLIMNVLNHNSIGGWTKEDLEQHKKEKYYDNPKRYKVRVTIEVG